MDAMRITGQTRVLGLDQRYKPLPVLDAKYEDGTPVMLTCWRPNADELAALNAGAAVQVAILGVVHPPINVSISEIPK